MSDPEVQRWRQQGRIFLWRYRDKPRNYPGWHLSADAPGAQSLVELCRLMEGAQFSSETSIIISDPTASVLSVPNYIRGAAKWQSAHRWTIEYPKGKVAPGEWQIRFSGEELRLRVGGGTLEQLERGIEDIRNGHGDYTIGSDDTPESDRLWLWWYA
jgi:hypothetical protein